MPYSKSQPLFSNFFAEFFAELFLVGIALKKTQKLKGGNRIRVPPATARKGISSMKKQSAIKRNIREVHGNLTRIDPVQDIYPLYTTYAPTQYPDTRNGTIVPFLPINKVIDSKECVDNIRL